MQTAVGPMRTTVEITDEQRSKLLEAAARNRKHFERIAGLSLDSP
jgi:hypothetical protein